MKAPYDTIIKILENNSNKIKFRIDDDLLGITVNKDEEKYFSRDDVIELRDFLIFALDHLDN